MNLAMTLLAGAAALSVGGADASDFLFSTGYLNSDLVQPVRMVCGWRTGDVIALGAVAA